jgi:hypothetical protein
MRRHALPATLALFLFSSMALADTAPGDTTPGNTTYVPSPGVSAAVLKQFAGYTATVTGQKPDAVLPKLQQVDMIGQWRRAWEDQGLHVGDVKDAYAAYWITNWVIANRLDSESKAQTLGALAQLGPMLAKTKAITGLDNDGKQQAAEIFMLNSVMQAANYIRAKQQGEEATAETLSDAAEQRFLQESHVDLRAMALTDHGFARKS